MTLVGSDDALLVERLHLLGTIFVSQQDLRLLRRSLDVLETDGQTRPGGVLEPEILDVVERVSHIRLVVAPNQLIDEHADVCL